MNATKYLCFWLVALIDEISIFTMKSLIDLVDLIDWPLAFILDCFILAWEIAFLDCSFAAESSTEFTELLITMISNSHQSVVIVEHDSEAIHESKIAVALEAGEGSDDIVVIREGTCEFDKREVVVWHIHLQQFDKFH